MKVRVFVLLLLMVASTLVERAYSQTVPSAVAIIPSQAPAVEVEDSNRYEKRTSLKSVRKKTSEFSNKQETSQVTPHPQVAAPLDQATSLTDVAPLVRTREDGSSIGPDMRDVIIGGPGEAVGRYRSYLAPDDIRRNLVELELATQLIYNDSRSDYYYRNYITSSPGGRLGLRVWLTPFLGINATYEKTFLGSMKKSFGEDNSRIGFTDSWLQIGLRFRRFSSYSILSPSLTFGIDYAEYKKIVPLDDREHSRLTTGGILLSAETKIPTSETLNWNLGLDYMPYAVHREWPTVGDVRSGTSANTTRMGASFGPEIHISRAQRMHFKVKGIYERNSFSDKANTADPRNGDLPENVSITNSFVFIELGYTWGN